MNWDNWDEVQAYLAQQQAPQPSAPATVAQPTVYKSFDDPRIVNGTANLYDGPATPGYGGQYSYDVNNVLHGQGISAYQTPISAKNGSADVAGGAMDWIRFRGTNGEPLAAMPNGQGGYQVFADPGDMGGSGLKGAQMSRMNGINYDNIDANGNYLGGGTFSGWKDGGIGDTLGVLSILSMAGGAAAAGLGSAGAGGAAAGTAGAGEGLGAAGAAGGIGDATAAGYGGLNAASAATMGGGASVGGGSALGALGGAGAAGGSTLSQILSSLGGSGGASGFNWGSLIGPAMSAIGAGVSANAAGNAADAQVQSTRESNALLKDIFDKQVALQEPFRQGGIQGLNRLLDLYGISGNTGAAGYGSAMKKFGMEDFNADPGYQFRQDEGLKALERKASANGGLYSGKAEKDILRFSQGLASDEYGKAYDRYGTDIARQINPLQALAGQGQSSANTLTGAAGTYGSNVANNITSAGNATAAGIVGQSNALNNGLSQGYSMYQQNNLMNRLLPAGSY